MKFVGYQNLVVNLLNNLQPDSVIPMILGIFFFNFKKLNKSL